MARNEDLGWMGPLDVARIEKSVSMLRVLAFAVLALLMLAAGVEGSMPWFSAISAIVLLAIALVPTAMNWAAARRRQFMPVWWYAGHTADVVAITGAILISILTQSPQAGLLGALQLAYFVVIIGSATRFHVPSTVYATVLCIASYVGIAIFASLRPSLALHAAAMDDLVQPAMIAMRPITMAVAGAVSVTLIRRAQKVTAVLAEADRKQSRIIQQARDGFLMCDADHRAVEVNAAACEILGMPRSNLIGLRATVVLPAPIAAVVRARWQEILDEGSLLAEGIRFSTLHAERRVDLSAQRIAHPDSPVVLLVLHDVTAYYKLRDQAAQYERLQALRALTTGVAHEFNNIFATIEASSFILSEATSKQSPQYTEVESIRNAAARAARFARDLLDMADMRAPSARPLDTSALLRKAVEANRIEGSTVEVKFDIPEDIRRIRGDQGQLERALGNMVAHGFRAMLDGGTLTISARNVTLAEHDGNLAAGDYVRLTLRDTGIGMPADVAAKTFDPLSQSDAGTPGAVGLGNVQAAVDRHGGSVHVESTVGQGTVFTLMLPASCEPREIALQESEQTGAQRSRRLLVVDDEPANRTSLARLLSFRGYEVLLADDGLSAIRIAEEQGARIDLVLLDLLMPEMNGKDVLMALRAMHPHMKVLLVTGYAEQVMVQEALDLGASGVAYKPFDVPALLEQVQQLAQAQG